MNVVPERMSVTIEVSTEVDTVGTIWNDVSISSEVRVSRAVCSVTLVAITVWVANVDTRLVNDWTSVEV